MQMDWIVSWSLVFVMFNRLYTFFMMFFFFFCTAGLQVDAVELLKEFTQWGFMPLPQLAGPGDRWGEHRGENKPSLCDAYSGENYHHQNRLETEKRQGAVIEREQLGKVLPEATDMRTVKCSLLPGCTLNGQYGVEHIHKLTFMRTFVRKGKKEERNFSEKKWGMKRLLSFFKWISQMRALFFVCLFSVYIMTQTTIAAESLLTS